jgi:predicted transglutaminase-like cysteine proteinase
MRCFRRNRRVLAALLLVVFLAPGCAHVGVAPLPPGPFAYFTSPARDDPWSPKIAGWQARELADQTDFVSAPASVSGPGESAAPADATDLRAKYAAFRAEQRRQQAREVAGWIQENARGHYRSDGAFDHWATLEETLAHDGDDCDGLELLAFNLLRELGFADDEVFRAIVVRAEDGQHHMVTLWFENPDDPWVIDPTGAMVRGMPRMSEVAGWAPLKVFSDTREFTPQEIAAVH